MALIDARQRRWIGAAVILGAAATVAFLRTRLAGRELTGSSGPGLWFGIAAAALMLFEVALNLRKRVPTWRIGRAETWFKGHIWLGLLIVPLVCFHSGFRFQGTLAGRPLASRPRRHPLGHLRPRPPAVRTTVDGRLGSGRR